MNELNCSVTLDSVENKITVNGLRDSALNINTSGDVDFTDLVQELTKKIDEEKTIVLTVENEENITNSKDKLIIDTLKKIFDSYNESLKDNEAVGDDSNEDEIPF